MWKKSVNSCQRRQKDIEAIREKKMLQSIVEEQVERGRLKRNKRHFRLRVRQYNFLEVSQASPVHFSDKGTMILMTLDLYK
jgi:hypothetical protein